MDAITTERLYLRPFTADDMDDFAEILANPDVMRFSLEKPKTKDESRSTLEFMLTACQKDGFGLFAVMLRAEQKFIGYCGFVVRRIDGLREIELGCGFSPAYWGKGFATEAMKACRDFGFMKLGFPHLISIFDPKNLGAIRVAEKLDMKFETRSEFHGSPLIIYGVARGKA